MGSTIPQGGRPAGSAGAADDLYQQMLSHQNQLVSEQIAGNLAANLSRGGAANLSGGGANLSGGGIIMSQSTAVHSTVHCHNNGVHNNDSLHQQRQQPGERPETIYDDLTPGLPGLVWRSPSTLQRQRRLVSLKPAVSAP